jgi:ribA/ribD-fused uncharacterized protein
MSPFQQYIEDNQINQITTVDTIFFWKIDSDFGEFCQWYRSDFVCDDETFATTEQYMMYKKAMMFGDSNMSERILCSSSANPRKHKSMGRKVANFDEVIWESRNMNVAINGNYCKFTQNADLMKLLLGTGDKMIVEASPMDRIWGIGFDSTLAMSNVGRWGQNRLGKSLMTVRSMIKDVLTKMPAGVWSKIPVGQRLITLCYHCLSTITITPPTESATRNGTRIMITTCNDCMKRHVLAIGTVDQNTLMTMMRFLPAETKTYMHPNPTSNDAPYTVVHPDTLKLLDSDGCTISELRGFKDQNGELIHNWRSI